MSETPRPAGDRVDVLLPTHARPHTIGFSIEAVLRQSHSDLTLHVVGDGCDAKTESLVRSIDDPRVRFHGFPKAPGYGYANRNLVLRSLTGDYVAYAADDDLWFPDHLEHGIAAIRELGLSYTVRPSVHVRSGGALDPHFFAFDWQVPILTPFLQRWFLGATNMVHRRELFGTIGYWNEDIVRFGDREFLARARRSGLPSDYRNIPTAIRFYAQDWDPMYARGAEPPQAAFLEHLQDRAWVDEIRRQVLPGRRSLASRRRQWSDVFRFARVSGPKFLKFLVHRRRTGGHAEKVAVGKPA